MKWSDLSADDRKFLDDVHYLKARDRAAYLSILALILCMQSDNGKSYPEILENFESATKGELKRCIKHLREAKSVYAFPDDLEHGIHFIRNEFLRKEVTT